MNWRKAVIISLTAEGTAGLWMMSTSKVYSVSWVHSQVSVNALIWAGDSWPVRSRKRTL